MQGMILDCDLATRVTGRLGYRTLVCVDDQPQKIETGQQSPSYIRQISTQQCNHLERAQQLEWSTKVHGPWNRISAAVIVGCFVLRWRRDFLTSRLSFLLYIPALLVWSSNPPALTRLLDDHSVSESPVQIGVLQQLILCWLLRPDITFIWLDDDVMKLTTAEVA